jgi:hypothetical protein
MNEWPVHPLLVYYYAIRLIPFNGSWPRVLLGRLFFLPWVPRVILALGPHLTTSLVVPLVHNEVCKP